MLALIAHDGKKEAMAAWVGAHLAALRRYKLVATGTTGTMVGERYRELDIRRVASGPRGGDQQIGAMIVEGQIEALIFFVDALAPQPHDVDIKALMRLAILYDIPAAFNPRSADAVLRELTRLA